MGPRYNNSYDPRATRGFMFLIFWVRLSWLLISFWAHLWYPHTVLHRMIFCITTHNSSGDLTSVDSPSSTHAVPLQCDSRQCNQRFHHVEVAQRTHFKERHVAPLCVLLCHQLTHFTLERKVTAIPNQDLWHSWHMLKPAEFNYQTSIDSMKELDDTQTGKGNISMHGFCFSLSLSFRFNGHFPGEPGLAGVYWSKRWRKWWCGDNWSYKLCKAPVKSSPPTNQTQFLQAGCPSCCPTNNVKALKGKISHSTDLLTPSSPGSSNFVFDH